MSEAKEQVTADSSPAAGAKALDVKALDIKALDMQPLTETLAGINEHYLHRIQAEWQEAFDLVAKINGTTLAADKASLYQDWLKDFSRRRVEDANYILDAVRTLSGLQMKFSAGLAEKATSQAAKAA